MALTIDKGYKIYGPVALPDQRCFLLPRQIETLFLKTKITAEIFKSISKKMIKSAITILKARIKLQDAINGFRGAEFWKTEYIGSRTCEKKCL